MTDLHLTERLSGTYHHKFYMDKRALTSIKNRIQLALLNDTLSASEWDALENIVKSEDVNRIEAYLTYLTTKDARTCVDKLLLRKPIYRSI